MPISPRDGAAREGVRVHRRSASAGARSTRSGPRSAAARLGIAAVALSAPSSLAPPRACGAEFTAKDGQVLGRTMGYVGDGKTGLAVVGIVFVPDDPASRREADLVRAAIGEGLPAGRVKLQARLVPVAQLPATDGVDALYVAAGVGPPPVLLAARRLRVPTVSTDMACVEAAQCVVGFSSEPTVQIVISRGAAERAGVRFTQAFRMLVTER